MATLTFETLSFRSGQDSLHVDLLKAFTTSIPNEELESIGPFQIKDLHTLHFAGVEQNKAELKFAYLLEKHFPRLKTKITGNKAAYIHRNSGIPLIGNVAFGLVYRGSSVIEIKPSTSCNLDCVYCSISEGLSSKKNDFVVEKDYLVEELQNLIKWVDEPVEVHIGVQGEPFLYDDMINLIEDLQEMKMVHTVSIDTNGSLLSKEKIDGLAHCTKLQMNLSLDGIDEDKARRIAGVKTYNIKHVKKMIAYASEKIKVIVAPVLTMGFNEDEMEKIILFIKSLPKQPILGIQNFLRYKTGRNPGKQMSWDDFYLLLEKLEKKHQIKLKLNKDDFNITPTKKLPKPFKLGDKITATIKCQDRFSNSVIAVARGRNISVPNCKFVREKRIKIEITRDKHNIFAAKLL